METLLIWIIIVLCIATFYLWRKSKNQKSKIDELLWKISNDNDCLNGMHKNNETLTKKYNQLYELTLMVDSKKPNVLQRKFDFVQKGGDPDPLLLDETTQYKISQEIIQKEAQSLMAVIIHTDGGSKESLELIMEYKLAFKNIDCLLFLDYHKDKIREIFQRTIESIVFYAGIIDLMVKIPNSKFLNIDVSDLVSQRVTEISNSDFAGVESSIDEGTKDGCASSVFESLNEIINRRYLDPTIRLEFINRLRTRSKKYVELMLSELNRENPENIKEAEIVQRIYNKYHL